MIKIQEGIPLAPLTTLRVGGMAKYFAEIGSPEELKEAIVFAEERNLKTVILGGGSNVLVSDGGFDGLVIFMKGSEIEFENDLVKVSAGTLLAELVRKSAEEGLSGMEWATGIPVTVGGAIRGNAGAYGGDIGKNVVSVRVFDMDKSEDIGVVNLSKEECCFNYRSSMFKKNPNLVILSAELKLEKGDMTEIKEKTKDIAIVRAGKTVRGSSAGSFFMNPVVTDEHLRSQFSLDTGREPTDDTLPAGWLIEGAGLKGRRIGGAMVSEQHGNFIINTGNATAEDIVMLVSIIKQKVRNKYKIQLVEEIAYIGF